MVEVILNGKKAALPLILTYEDVVQFLGVDDLTITFRNSEAGDGTLAPGWGVMVKPGTVINAIRTSGA